MAKTEEVHVEFQKYWQAHVPGDVASFPKSTADKLVEAKIATFKDVEVKKATPGAQVTK